MASAATQPNIVLILTDDQRFDALWAMPVVQSELVSKGVTFTNAYVSNPLCCPSRVSILTGQYSHTNGVYTNYPPEGGFDAFDDSSTVAVWLQGAGYRTALIGKYLNAYTDARSGYIPPGWDRWFAFTGKNGQGNYFGFRVSDQGVNTTYEQTEYSTDVLADEAVQFISATPLAKPLFLYLAPKAPHGPPRSADRHLSLFDDLPPYRPPNYNESDVSDKPAYIQARAEWTTNQQQAEDEYKREEFRTLMAVDDAVGRIIAALAGTGRLDNTLILFMSDNGRLGGEHRFNGKMVPYEESIRVPLVIRYDGIPATPRADGRLVLNIDVAPTLADAGSVSAPSVDGSSMLPLLVPLGSTWRNDFLLEHRYLPPEPFIPTYCGVHTRRYVYVDYATGEMELYDLLADPYQLGNVIAEPGYAGIREDLQARLEDLCTPAP